MCVCVYVCLYICVCVYMFVCVYVYVCILKHRSERQGEDSVSVVATERSQRERERDKEGRHKDRV